MNKLRTLLKLRGLTIRKVAALINRDYHMTQKVISGATYKRGDGTRAVYRSQPIENAVATLLGLSHADVWGESSDQRLEQVILTEIENFAHRQQQQLTERLLPVKKNTPKRRGGLCLTRKEK